MAIPTEPIGSIPRPPWLIEAGRDLAAGRITADAYAELAYDALRETIGQFGRSMTKVSPETVSAG